MHPICLFGAEKGNSRGFFRIKKNKKGVEKREDCGLKWSQVVTSGGKWYKVGSDVEAHIKRKGSECY